jgi:hypothetical protein
LLIVFMVWMYPAVEAAQTTSIYQVNSPSSVVAGRESPIPVVATVYYNNTIPGYELVVAILEAGLPPGRIVPGIVVSSTDPCVNQPEPAALCVVTTRTSSGVERIDFQIGGIFGGKRGPGTWDLNVTSVLIDSQRNLVPASVSSRLFEIGLTPVALSVIVPSSVAVSVDGLQQPPGPATVSVALGRHNITLPMLVQMGPSTRLRFDHWSDGYLTAFRTIVVRNTTSLQGVYVTENLLTLVDAEQNATGSGWYGASTNATFSASQYQPLAGLLGAIGGRLSFQGWYENGQLLTNSPTGTIAMDTPHILTAVWQADYSTPATISLGAIAAILIIFLVLRRRKERPRRRRRSKRSRRKH